MSNRLYENTPYSDVLADIINHTTDAIISLDAHQNIMLVNASFEYIFGYTQEEIIGKSITLLLPKNIHKKLKKYFTSYAACEEKTRQMGQRSDLYGLSKTGQKIPLDISLQKHAEGSSCLFTVICRDISHRLERESRVKEEEEKFKTLFDASHDFTILMNGSGQVVEFNNAAIQLLNRHTDKHIGQQVWDCDFWASETDFSLIEEAVSTVKPGQNITLIANARNDKLGQIILDITLKATRIEYKKSSLIILEGRDITEVVHANRALSESQARLSRAQRIARLGNWDWNLRTNEVICSDEIYNIFQIPKDKKILNYDFFLDAIHPDDRAHVELSIVEGLTNNAYYQISHRIILPDGTKKVVEMLGEIIRTKEGAPIRLDGTVQDITESWTREQDLLREKLRAEEGNIAKVQFLSAMSHELRTPLNAILGFSSMIAEEQLGKINNQFYKDYAVNIHRSGNDLMELIKSLLHVTNCELGSVKFQPDYFTAQELFEKTMPLLYNRAGRKNITIEITISDNMPELFLDLRHMKKILGHLMDNAVKFSLNDSVIKVALYFENDEVKLDVMDNGIGLDDTDLDTIFDLFVQKDMTINKLYGGTGLGLTIVKKLVDLQGGKIHVTNNEGQGSCFSISFPQEKMENYSAVRIGQMA